MVTEKINILVVEDDVGIQNQLKWSLDDYNVSLTDHHAGALDAVRQSEPSVVLLDLGLPPDPGGATEGLRILNDILTIAPSTKVIIITGNDDRANAVQAVGTGAYDFYNKPIDADELSQVIARAIRLSELEEENARLHRSVGSSTLDGIIAVSEPMAKVCRDIEKLAPLDVSTMLLGESGTGKELLARALHELSPRAQNNMVAINCAAIPDNLLESELFGYEKGAFTGATKQTKGKLEYANGGTLFLDEIGDLPLSLQAKLLRFLQEKKIERVGGRSEISVDTRVISATHKDLQQLIAEKLFREDLYYRLGEMIVTIPPLRDRGVDVQILAKFLLQKFSKELGKTTQRFSAASLKALASYSWPGNIRELENCIKRAAIMSEGKIVDTDVLGLPEDFIPEQVLNLKQARDLAERDVVKKAIIHADGNMTKAAKNLGISRPTLYDLIERLNIDVSGGE